MMVIDIGCATHGGDDSIGPLIEEFRPRTLWGFDPAVGEGHSYKRDGTKVVLLPEVAWTFDGAIGFQLAGLGGHIDVENDRAFNCFDLARLVHSIDDEIVLKIDAEGAEYDLVPHLVAKDADLKIKLMLIEWHCDTCKHGIWGDKHPDGCLADLEAWIERREMTKQGVRCEIQEWNR